MQSVLEKALPIVAKAVSEKYTNLQVVLGGKRACTDGNIIYLPILPETEDARILARGYIDHEAAHVRFTDFSVKNTYLINALEDIRIEEKQSRQFAGAKKNLRDLNDWFIKQGKITVSSSDSHHDILAKYVHFKLRRDVLGHCVTDLADAAGKEFEKRFGGKTRKEVDNIIRPALRSTSDAARRAEKLKELLKDCLQNQPDKPGKAKHQPRQTDSAQSQPEGDSGSETDFSDQDSEGSSSGGREAESNSDNPSGDCPADTANVDDDEQNAENSQAYEESGSDTRGENNDQKNGPGSADGNEAGQNGNQYESDADIDLGPETFQGVGEIAEELLNKIGHENKDGNLIAPHPIRPGRLYENTDQYQWVSWICEDAVKQSAKLRKKLQGVLEAKRMDRPKRAYSGKKFSRRDLHRLFCGDTRIFSRPVERKGVNTAVHLLLDLSMSMADNAVQLDRELDRAVKACYSLSLALDKVKYVNFAVTGFPGSSPGRSLQDVDEYVVELKKFGEPLRWKNFNVVADGTTPTAEAMLHAAHRLACQREQRKMVFVITDGKPNSFELTQQTEKWLEKYGIEVFGIGIKCPEVANVFKKSIVVEDINELAESLFKTLEKKL